MEKFPFEYTPIIKRYLEEIIERDKLFLLSEEGNIGKIETFRNGEDITPFSRRNSDRFWDYLIKTEAIEWAYKNALHGGGHLAHATVAYRKDYDTPVGFITTREFKVLDIGKIKILLENFEKVQHLHSSNSRSIEGDSNKKNTRRKELVSSIEIYAEKLKYVILVNGEKKYVSRRKNTEEKKKKAYWDYIYEIAENGSSEVEYNLYQGVVSFFNSSKMKNPLYYKLEYEKTNILAYFNETLVASQKVIIRKLSRSKYEKI